MPRLARHVRVTGWVQGVFYRQWTCEQARELGAAGWIRNCADGSVEAHVEGSEEAVGQLIEKMRRGPSAAQVDHVAIDETAPESSDRFEVRR